MSGISEWRRIRQAETEVFEIPTNFISIRAPRCPLRTLIPYIINHYVNGEPEYVQQQIRRCCQKDTVYEKLERMIQILNPQVILPRTWFLVTQRIRIPTSNYFFAEVFPTIDLTEQRIGVVRVKRCGVLCRFHRALELENIVRDTDLNVEFANLSDTYKRMIRQAVHEFRIYTSPDIHAGDGEFTQEELDNSDTKQMPEAIKIFQIDNMRVEPDSDNERIGHINSETLVGKNAGLVKSWRRRRPYWGIRNRNTEEWRHYMRPGVLEITAAFNQEGTAAYGTIEGDWGGERINDIENRLMEYWGCAIILVANIAHTLGLRSITPDTIRTEASHFNENTAILRWGAPFAPFDGITLLDRVSRPLTAERFNRMANSTTTIYCVGIDVNWTGNPDFKPEDSDEDDNPTENPNPPRGPHWVGVSELLIRDVNVTTIDPETGVKITTPTPTEFFRISPTSALDWVMGTSTARNDNNRRGLGWDRLNNGQSIYVPLSQVTGYVIYSIKQRQ